MAFLVLLRHGQSAWNQKNLFTGWTDVDLTEQGEQEARDAGRLLAGLDVAIELCFTSFLRRAIRTLDLALGEMGRSWLPVRKSWRLNERHYGALQGLDKAVTAEKYGAAKVAQWRRSWGVAPPPLDADDPAHPALDPRYALLPPGTLPVGESLEMTVARVMPYWVDVIAPELAVGRNVLVCAHGNSLRGLVKVLSGLSDDEIAGFEIPTGQLLVYELDAKLRVLDRRIVERADDAPRAADTRH